MSEGNMWRTVRSALAGLDPVRVENPVDPGTPDVNYVEGWVELKQEDEWPKRETTPLRVYHFTPQQRVWLTTRVKSGGRAFMLIKVGRDWLLFRGDVAARIVGHTTRQQMIKLATRHWLGKLVPEELRECLTK